MNWKSLRGEARKLIVPKRSSAAIHAAGAAGVTVRNRPSGMRPPCSRRKNAAEAAAGQTPSPSIVTTSPLSARRIMIGATPATLTMSLCSTPSAIPAATPASIALPPASRTRKPACAAA
jgi:hypothetical protein